MIAKIFLIHFNRCLEIDPAAYMPSRHPNSDFTVHVEQMITFTPFVTKPVFSGMSRFNATYTIAHSEPDYIRRVVNQDFVLAPFADYRVYRPKTLIGCVEPSCLGFRIHDNIEYAIVPPSNWSRKDPVPEYSATWKSEFDPANPTWDVFSVKNASTFQIEFLPLESNVVFNVSSDCHIYGYPYLALQICLRQGISTNVLIIGNLSLFSTI